VPVQVKDDFPLDPKVVISAKSEQILGSRVSNQCKA